MAQQIASNAKIYPNVIFGDNIVIEDFCVIGIPPVGSSSDVQTVIGDNAIIRSHCVIYAGNKIGNNFQMGNKANIREMNEIGDNVSIGTLSVIEHHVILQDGVRLHSQVFVPEFTTIKREAWIGPNVVLTNARYPLSPGQKEKLKGPIIGERAIVGANATVLPGIIIGRSALIGAGSVVTHNVLERVVVKGNPAKKLKSISELPYFER